MDGQEYEFGNLRKKFPNKWLDHKRRVDKQEVKLLKKKAESPLVKTTAV